VDYNSTAMPGKTGDQAEELRPFLEKEGMILSCSVSSEFKK
jgi:hypothetical protein